MSQRTVFVLGSQGMLGHAVARWLQQRGFQVQTTTARYGGAEGDALLREVAASGAAAVVNCVGTSVRRARDARELFLVNALLPQLLGAALGPERLLVHASSDGVFDGQRGDYGVDEPPNALDPQGMSKRLGELAVHLGRVVVLRCSIIGLDAREPRNLLSWFLSQERAVTGHTDQRWNGVTTLEWAKLAERALCSDPDLAPGMHQPAAASPVSKYELLQIAARAFRHGVPLLPGASGNPVDRTLRPTLVCPPLEQQLDELRRWHEKDPVP